MIRIAHSIVMALVLVSVAVAPAMARQNATPTIGLSQLDLPELNITVTATSFEGVPASTAAGRYLVNITATEDTAENDGGSFAFVQPPEGMTPDDFFNALSGSQDEAPPAELFESLFAGGGYATPGSTTQVVLDLTPGEWIAWGDEPEAPQTPVIFEVTGEMPGELPEPESSATLTMAEFLINVSEGALVAGSQVLKIENVGAQPHFVALQHGPDTMTTSDIKAILDAEMTGTPPATDFDPDELVLISYTGTQSLGTTTWIPVELEPGAVLLICFFPDMADGMPHAYHGMFNVVEVAA